MNAIYVGTSASSTAALPREPVEMTFGLMDISSSDAGRTQDANYTMHKMRVAQKRKLTLAWSNLTLGETSTILNAFNPEYVYVRYIDPKDGTWRTAKFYTGDKSSSYREIRNPISGTVMKALSFNLVEV